MSSHASATVDGCALAGRARRARAPARSLALLIAGVLTGVLAGCTSAEFNRSYSAPTYPPFKGEVEVLELMPPAGTFERLGVVVATGGDAGTKQSLVRQLKKTAAAGGANAISLQHADLTEYSTHGGGTQTKLAAWAIRLRP